jgi:hypothetical protein
MSRSVCRVMMGVAGLAVLGMAATLAGAHTGYAGTYKLKPDAPDADDAVRTLSSFYVQILYRSTQPTSSPHGEGLLRGGHWPLFTTENKCCRHHFL